MSDFGGATHPTARKRLRCVMCWTFIPPGEKYVRYKGKYEGEWQNWAAHQECYETYMDQMPGEEFTPGDFEPPERLRTEQPCP